MDCVSEVRRAKPSPSSCAARTKGTGAFLRVGGNVPGQFDVLAADAGNGESA